MDPISIIFKEVGGAEPIYKLVDEFYAGVEEDFILRPLYPEDLTGPKERLALFLIQRTGGPTTYSDQRGHPRMRARHMPFPIGQAERDAWVRIMDRALNAVPELEPHRESLREFFSEFATFMINKQP
ncbi:MAG: globin [Cyanobacteria bacterium HKST-UBA02]|nr:globin [Cyanobacteria bacterium HKST-UBA02]